jgi:hypothetical protein
MNFGARSKERKGFAQPSHAGAIDAVASFQDGFKAARCPEKALFHTAAGSTYLHARLLREGKL